MFWIAIALITISSSYFALERQKLKSGERGLLGPSADLTNKRLQKLQEENDRMEERIRNLEYIVSDRKDYIDIEYEKEQVRLDKDQQKFRY